MTYKFYWVSQKKYEMTKKEDQSFDRSICFLTVYKKFTHHQSEQDSRLESTYLECQFVL